MQKIRRIILLFSSLFIFNHTAGLHAITYEYVTYGHLAYGSGNNTGTSSGGTPSTTPGSGSYQYPEIYQQQQSEKEKQEKAEAEARAKEEAARIIAEAEARLAEEKRQAEEQARLEEEARQVELARQEEERQRQEAEHQAELARQEAERQRQEAEKKAQAEAQKKAELQNEISELITEIQSITVNNNKTSDKELLSGKITELQQELASLEDASSNTQDINIEENTNLAQTVNSDVTGDPVKTSTGACIQTSDDIAAGYFQITRYYESDRKTISAFGAGWCSNLDERIILGTQPMVQEVYSQMTKNLQSLINQREEYEAFICTNLAVNSVETARQEIEEKLRQSEEILSRANMFVPEFDITADEVFEQTYNKIQLLQNDLQLLDHYLNELEKLKQEIEKNRQESYNFENSILIPDQERRSRNSKVYYSGDDLNKYETGHDTITFIDSQGYPHLLYESQGNSKIWKSKKDKTILECHEEADLYVIVEADGIKKYFDFFGQLIKIVDRNNRFLQINRRSDGKIQSLENSFGETLLFTYSSNYIKSITNKRDSSCKTMYSYSGNKLVSYTDIDGDTLRMNYDEEGRLTCMTKCDGSKVQYVYGEKSFDGKTLTTSTINEEGFAETFIYDLANKKTIYKNHDGNSTIYYYDQNHRTVRQENPDGSVIQNRYDEDGKLLEKNQNGMRLLYSYDVHGNITAIFYSDGSSEEFAYDKYNLLTYYKNRDGVSSEYTRDERGNIILYKCGSKRVYEMTYNQQGNITQEIVYGEKEIINSYDYDSFGNLIFQQKGNLTICNQYDERNRLITHKQNNKVISSYRYEKGKTIRTDYNGLETTIVTNGRKDITDIIRKDLITGKIIRTKVEYDKRHLPVKIYKGDDKRLTLTVSYSYTPAGLLASQTIPQKSQDENALITSYEYQNGLISKTKKYFEGQEASAIIERYNFANTASGGFRLTSKNALGIESIFDFDAHGNIIKHTDGGNKTILSEFSPEGKLLRKQNQYGGWYCYNYDEAGNILKSGEEAALYKRTYNNDGSIKTQTDPLGNTTYYSYDNCANLICEKEKTKTQWYKYDDFNRLIVQITGQTADLNSCEYYITYDYSEDGRKKIVTQGGLYPVIYEYDAFGNNISMTDGNNNRTFFEYDYNNMLICQTDSYGNKTQYTYNNFNQIKTITLPDSQKYFYEYNCNKNLIKVQDSLGQLYAALYDQAGRLIKQNQRGYAPEGFEYNKSNKITKYYFGNELVQSFSFSSNNKEMTVKDGNLADYHYTYDNYGRLIKEQNRLGDYQFYSYDKLGSLTQTTNFDGSKTFTTNPAIDETQVIKYADNSQNSYTYNMTGNIIQAENQNNKSQYVYDKGGKLIEQKDIDTQEVISFSYDRAGNLIELVSSNRDTHYVYGKNNEIIHVYDSRLGIDIKLEYDCNGRELCRRFANGTQVQCYYDQAGRTILKIHKDRSSQIIWAQGYIYQEDGRICTSVDQNACVCFYEYDSQGRVSSVYYPYNQEHEEKLKELAQTNGLDTKQSLATNRFLSSSEKSKLENLLNQMRYTLAYSLKTNQILIKESFTYDKNGNLQSRTSALGTIEYSYDKENHLISSGSNGKTFVHYSYDKRGNLILQESPFQKFEYEYNYQNRMISCRATDNSARSQSYSQYAYDAFGRRILSQDSDNERQRTIYKAFTFDIIKESTVFANGLFTRFGYSGHLYENSGTPNGDRYRFIEDKNDLDTNRYSNINKDTFKITSNRYKGERTSISINNSLAAQVTDVFGTAYLSTDILGSVRASTDQYGLCNASSSFDIFGSPVSGDYSNTAAVDLGYTGKQFDPTSRLYNYGYRDYNPITTRFTSQDPIRYGFNWFSYCDGDPVNFVDINGLFSYKGDEQTTDDPASHTTVYIYRPDDGLGNDFDGTRVIIKKDAAGNQKVYVDAVGANCKPEYYKDKEHDGSTTPDGKYYLTAKWLYKKEDGTYDSESYKNVLALATKDKSLSAEVRNVINKLDRLFHPNQFKNTASPYNSNESPGSAGCIIGKDGQEHQDEMMEFLMENVDRPESITVIITSNSNQGGCSQ